MNRRAFGFFAAFSFAFISVVFTAPAAFAQSDSTVPAQNPSPSTPPASASQTPPKKIWTNDDIHSAKTPSSDSNARPVNAAAKPKPNAKGKDAGWYLRQAGGPTPMANRKAIFVIRADGSVVGGTGSMFGGGVENAELRPGDMVVVPEQIYGFSDKFKTTLSIAQVAASVGSAIAIAAYYGTH